MSDLEWDILDQAYFMNGFQNIRDAVQATPEALENALVELLRGGLLRQLEYSEPHSDFIDVEPFAPTRFGESQFVITKKGLLAHTSL
ncbi:MAG TPA: hypothetical protein VEY71_12620 [Chitinophagales bacterium]|nr:hypothetical protein [Chitinophagales bacterium]